MNDEALAFSNLGHAYKPDQWVFRNYAATFTKRRAVALLGPNGRGKTTLLKALLGVLTPSAGEIRRSGTVAFVPQLFQVMFDYSVLDMVLMGRAKNVGLFSQPAAGDREIARRTLARLGIEYLAERSFQELSGGQRQLVIFARALVAQPDMLLLDEPTSALDLRNQAAVLSWMVNLTRKDGLTLVFTTHHPHHALAVADDVLLMTGPDSFIFGPAGDVLNEGTLTELYGVPMKRITFEYDGTIKETLVPMFTAGDDV